MGASDVWHWWGRLPTWGVAAFVAFAVLATAAGASLGADFDGDGLSTWDERSLGTPSTHPDADGDGVVDGDEVRLGTDPLRPDTDGDGLADGDDVRAGGDPLSQDTDGDGIPDASEPDEDCDGDGIRAIASSDDDSDLLPDAAEPPASRCDPDADGDTVLDGQEGNFACLLLRDCDDDGLPDAQERQIGYDPLDPDTFSTGFPDAVALAFAEAGQDPTPDADEDGIPDGWEQHGGLLEWGSFRPTPGTTDLFIEYVRVVGPDSGGYSWLNFTPAFEAVEQMFGEQGIRVQWMETIVERQAEERPDFLTPDDLGYFRSVLENGTMSTNPYVTSVILNPQQVQTHVGSVLGAAFLRSMVATVDYGAHTEVHFDTPSGRDITIRPIVESHIQAGEPDLIRAYGYDRGGLLPDGRIFMERDHDTSLGQGFSVSWRPEWFQTAPVFRADDGQESQLVHDGATLLTDDLASTIAHELGHTLSLCHTHEAECAALYGASAADITGTTMSYAAPLDTLAFLPGEWQALRAHLSCPPQATAALVAQGAHQDDILAAKYDAAFTRAVAQRACEALEPMPLQFEPETDRTLREPLSLERQGQDGTEVLRIFGVVSVLATVGAVVLVVVARR